MIGQCGDHMTLKVVDLFGIREDREELLEQTRVRYFADW